VSEAHEKNKALVRRFLEVVYTKGDLDAIEELLSSEFVDRSPMPGQEADREGYKRSTAEIQAPFPTYA
jgi:ketosteroid isomerase-like protein